MKKLLVLTTIIALGLLLAGCGATQKTQLDVGQALVNSGDCAGAAPYLEDTIAQPDDILDLAYAYFLKGRCAEKANNAAAAYENFYAAKIVGCYAVAHDIHANLDTYARSDFCQRIIPDMLAKIEPKVGAEKVKKITTKVDGILNARYMEQFYKGKK